MILVAAGWRCSVPVGPEVDQCVFSGSGSFRCLLCLRSPAADSSTAPDLPPLCAFPAAQMYRAPVRPQRSPGAPRPAGRFPSPASCWGFPGARSPYGGSGHRGGSPRGAPAYSPSSPGFSPVYSPGSNRGHRDGSPAGLGGGSRGFGGQMWRRGGGFRRPQSFSPASAQKLQSSHSAVEKYFSPSMLQDPWAALQPVADRQTAAS